MFEITLFICLLNLKGCVVAGKVEPPKFEGCEVLETYRQSFDSFTTQVGKIKGKKFKWKAECRHKEVLAIAQ